MKRKINELPDIDTSKFEIDENGNVLRGGRMIDKELVKKAVEYRIKLVPYTELGYPDVEIPVYSALQISEAYIAGAKELQKENEQLKQEKAEYIKMLKDWEKLVCVNLSEGCCPSCEVCLFGELKEKTEGIERAE